MRKAIPERWLDYRPIGDRIAGTRFIAFKVPLGENINESVQQFQNRLAPQSLLESVPNLGLIVDLTNTNRYYSPQTFTAKNVEHVKLMIPGHRTPSKELAQRFCNYVTSFLKTNSDNDKLIGVHCTHGVNRTGYLICYFMITRMNMPPQHAIKIFGDARGHTIERDNYTRSLQNLIAKHQKPELPRLKACDPGYGQPATVPCDNRPIHVRTTNWRKRSHTNQSTRGHHAGIGGEKLTFVPNEDRTTNWRNWPQNNPPQQQQTYQQRWNEGWQGQLRTSTYAPRSYNRHYHQQSGSYHFQFKQNRDHRGHMNRHIFFDND